MKVERQGPKECMLATLAALRNVPLESVRKRACFLAGVKDWEEVFGYQIVEGQCYTMWELVVRKLGEEMNIPYDNIASQSIEFEGMAIAMKPIEITILPKGKGAISTILNYEGKAYYHIAPFENGRIYDPEAHSDYLREHGQTLEEYLKSYDDVYGKGNTKISNIGVIED